MKTIRCSGEIYYGPAGYIPPHYISIHDCENSEGIVLDTSKLLWTHEELGLSRPEEKKRIISPKSQEEIDETLRVI